MPAVRRLVADHGLDAEQIRGTGRGGRILKGDVLRYLEARDAAPAPRAVPPSAPAAVSAAAAASGEQAERVVPMTKLRQTIARRLVDAQQRAAILTTFNEVDMTAVKALRKSYRDAFENRHGVRLGFTSFFAKAAIEALRAFPAVNAEVRDDTIVYKDFYNIGVAVGGGRGLVVPVIRGADQLSFAEFERALAGLAVKAKENKLSLADLQGGTFTISNGGVYGSLLSTPILNPPQSGILGLHKIEDRPVAVNGEVVVRPMMYLALSYDHRIIDGREAVSFLVRIKECIEDPTRLLLEV
ncbi:MAG: dihydrolipoyllysine-residue succinyltransferase [Proteobacteria bacterium]|nr:MAG: dihydrolipoyllysine-residue succinyltransferase [Pseudomonadota bacterium]